MIESSINEIILEESLMNFQLKDLLLSLDYELHHNSTQDDHETWLIHIWQMTDHENRIDPIEDNSNSLREILPDYLHKGKKSTEIGMIFEEILFLTVQNKS